MPLPVEVKPSPHDMSQAPPKLVSFECAVTSGKLLPPSKWLAAGVKAYLAQHPSLGITTICNQQVKGAGEGFSEELLGCLWDLKRQRCWAGKQDTLVVGPIQPHWTVSKEKVRELLATPLSDDNEDDTVRYTLRLLNKEGKPIQELEDTITYRFPED